MGITNLNQLTMKKVYGIPGYCFTLTERLGRTPVVGVDAYVLLHRYLINEAELLCADENYVPRDSIMMIINHLKMFIYNKFDLYVVFDGATPHIKDGERETREKNRIKSLEKQKWGAAFKITKFAVDYFKECLQKANISYIVAPFEADPQLYYMEKTGVIDAIYTVDTDLISYGCKRIIYGIMDDKFLVYENTEDNGVIMIDTEEEIIDGTKYYRTKVLRNQPDVNPYDTCQYQVFSIMLGNDYTKKIFGLGPAKAKTIMEDIYMYFYDREMFQFCFSITIRKMMEHPIIKKLVMQNSHKLGLSEQMYIEKKMMAYCAFYKNVYEMYPVVDLQKRKFCAVNGFDLYEDEKSYYDSTFGEILPLEEFHAVEEKPEEKDKGLTEQTNELSTF